MTRLGPYEVHPLADAYPIVEGDEFDELVASVKANGLRHPVIVSHDGSTLIDGRNRLRACLAAGVDHVEQRIGAHYTDEMIAALIADENDRRRQMNAGQKAFVALRFEEYFAELNRRRRMVTNGGHHDHERSTIPADRRERRNRESAEQAAAMVGAAGRTVQRAKALERDAADLAEQVRLGRLALDAAERQRKARLAEQRRHEPEPAKPQPARTGPVMLALRAHDGREVPYPQPQGKATFNHTPGDGISWADWSWNPVTGCLHGCTYCYAREIAESPRYASAYPVGFTPLFHHERLDAPANTPLPTGATDAQRRVFVCSMADLYGRWVPQEWIDQVHAAELANPQWQYIHLTKFPDRYVGLDLPPSGWIGTSVDEQRRVRIAERAFAQLDGVAVKWLSLEPLREPLQFTDLSVFDWVVIGAQTETRQPDGVVEAFAPPFEWVARIVAQAREAGCKVHLKPNLHARPGMQFPDEYPTGTAR